MVCMAFAARLGCSRIARSQLEVGQTKAMLSTAAVAVPG